MRRAIWLCLAVVFVLGGAPEARNALVAAPVIAARTEPTSMSVTQEATAVAGLPVTPDPSECRVEPRPIEFYEPLIASATPGASLEPNEAEFACGSYAQRSPRAKPKPRSWSRR